MMRILSMTLLVLMAAGLSTPVIAGPKGCPPGLAKKAVPCVPPGQAKAWMLGERLPAKTPWYELRDWRRLGLPEPTEGSRYVRVGTDVLLVAIATGIVLEALGVIN